MWPFLVPCRMLLMDNISSRAPCQAGKALSYPHHDVIAHLASSSLLLLMPIPKKHFVPQTLFRTCFSKKKKQSITHSFLSPHSTLAPEATNKPPALEFDHLKESHTRTRKKEETGPSLISIFFPCRGKQPLLLFHHSSPPP